ncbi:hypothetical protein [Methyloceanibacter superfactus]|uniref:hypothetical protein n=1 Tax=Methyloceanibacter superfactus TaxID=1774969 RepID=UPI00114D2A73|nr:hypothetical protein [Methyloceanibacter superfactus]
MEEIVMGKKEGATTSENIKILTDKDQLGSAGASGTTTSAGSSGTTTSAGPAAARPDRPLSRRMSSIFRPAISRRMKNRRRNSTGEGWKR